jgi:hypothetical protein
VKNPDEEICSALNEIGKAFEENELAYLAVTSKIEHPFRDRLSFLLHRRYEAEGYFVAREWKRIDMAVLNHEGQPVCLIELKAMYTFDALTKPMYFASLLSNDEIKARRSASANTAVYSLLLATHVSDHFDRRYEGIVKYLPGIRKALNRHKTAAKVRELAEKTMRQTFSMRNVIREGHVLGGRVLGTEVTVLFWLVRDVFPPY